MTPKGATTRSSSSSLMLFWSTAILALSVRSTITHAFVFSSSWSLSRSSRAVVAVDSSSSSLRVAEFSSPLLVEGYRPAVDDDTSGVTATKPVLLYLPGFDGTLLAPFLQFPELGTTFDVRGMSVPYDDRSDFDGLREVVTTHVRNEYAGRPVYLVGESFGGLLASSVALDLREDVDDDDDDDDDARVDLRGLVLVNPATCYRRSELARRGEPLVCGDDDLTEETLSSWWFLPYYVLVLAFRLVPLFLDAHGLPQLLAILTSEALPSVVDAPAREAYMGRVALTLGRRLELMPPATLRWRLREWLDRGCRALDDGDALAALRDVPTLVVVGEDDRTLPSVEEARRLCATVVPDATTFVVDGAGHASTCGSRVDLAALMRGRFDGLGEGRTEMKETARSNTGPLFGMEPRYDGRTDVGMLPTRYWDDDLYRRWVPSSSSSS